MRMIILLILILSAVPSYKRLLAFTPIDRYGKKPIGKVNSNLNSPKELKIIRSWEMPFVLTEISGIAYLSRNRVACVQDEIGKIFIFNLSSSLIEKEIDFSGNGDYEGIAVVANDAYIIRSDGNIFEVTNFESEKPQVNQYATRLTSKHNVEGICFDKNNNRLLLAIKGSDPDVVNKKGIYAFDLTSKTMKNDPLFVIDLNDKIFDGYSKKKSKNKNNILRPSEICIHPKTGLIYITDAVNFSLLIMDLKGNIINKILLDRALFPQAEGITFTPAGDLYISNEGMKNGIVEVEVFHKTEY